MVDARRRSPPSPPRAGRRRRHRARQRRRRLAPRLGPRARGRDARRPSRRAPRRTRHCWSSAPRHRCSATSQLPRDLRAVRPARIRRARRRGLRRREPAVLALGRRGGRAHPRHQRRDWSRSRAPPATTSRSPRWSWPRSRSRWRDRAAAWRRWSASPSRGSSAPRHGCSPACTGSGCSRLSWPARARTAALVAVAPALWMSMDPPVMGDPLYSFHVTDDGQRDALRPVHPGENLEAAGEPRLVPRLRSADPAGPGRGSARARPACARRCRCWPRWRSRRGSSCCCCPGMASSERYLLVPVCVLAILAAMALDGVGRRTRPRVVLGVFFAVFLCSR